MATWLVLAASLIATGTAGAVQPPNPNDPCASAGRDICGTTGVGFYKNYRYGLRWFGDYTGVIAGASTNFCLDLGYWYPSAKDKYVLDDATSLENSRGETVSLLDREKLAYAIWAYGRSSNPDRQAAVMLYVHSLMGDARPGEVDPAAIGPAVASIDRQIAADANRFHGPYRLSSRVDGPLKAGLPSGATLRILSASGAAMPDLELKLTSSGVSGAPGSVTTNAQGVAKITFRPTASAGVSIAVTSAPVAATVPVVYKPTTPAAAANAQRIVTPTSQQVTGTVAGHITKDHISVTTAAAPTTQIAGHVVSDRITISGATPGWTAKVTVRIDGPFPSSAAVACGSPAWTGSFTTHGPGTYTSPVAAVTRPGWYGFQLRVPGDSANVGVRTSCSDPAERFFVQAQPTLSTAASAATVSPSTPIFDRVTVGSLAGTSVTADVDLFGPFAGTSAIVCSGTPVWSGSVSATANGSYQTASFTPTVPGVYAYRAQIDSTSLIRGSQGACGEAAETTVVSATPAVTTHASSSQVLPGGQIRDEVDVSGSGAFHLTVTVELFGPFASRSGIDCSGTPVGAVKVIAKGDGTFETQPVTLGKVGYYTFRESIPATSASTAFTGRCAETAETTLVSARPTVTTLVSADVVRPGSGLSDHIRVSGLGQTEAAVQVALYGPFESRAAIRCTGKPYSQTVVTAHGDGDFRSPPVRIVQAGFYAFHETLVGRPNVAGNSTVCGDTAETSLGAPAIITGRGDSTHVIAPVTSPAGAPARIQVPSLGIDAPVVASVIDVKQGVLGVPADIHKTGWWSDSASPVDPTGTVLIAGHVDSAAAGAGAFFPLKQARRGTLVQVTTASGQTKTYKVSSVETMLKEDLPTRIWSQKGPNRLVVVTCGGPFDQATGHYRDNIVVTAVRA
jgi:Sortase domain